MRQDDQTVESVIKTEDIVFTVTNKDPLLESIKTTHPAELARTFKKKGIHTLEQKAMLTHQSITIQNQQHTYPYERFLENGSNVTAHIQTPNTKKQKNCIVWTTNLYLGLNRHKKVSESIKKASDIYGSGSGTSAVCGGFSSIHKTLELNLSKFFNKEDTILYPTGFSANQGALSTLATKGDLILFDKDCHASIISGILLSGATFKSFKHCNPTDLKQKLTLANPKNYNNIFVVSESIFSLSGAEAPILDYCNLKENFQFYLYIDEAHSFGVYGKDGRGYCDELGCLDQIDFLMSTLSKATASIGGFISTKKEYCSLLRVSSNPFLFQASIPPINVASAITALHIFESEPELKEQLWKNTQKLREGIKDLGFNTGNSKSPIIPIYMKDDQKLAALCKLLFEKGIFTNWIAYPGVKKGHSRLRFVVSAAHSFEQIDETIGCLAAVGEKLQVI